MNDNDKIEGELLEKLKVHLIWKMRQHENEAGQFDCDSAEQIISAFDGVPTPPENPPGSGTR